MSKKLVIQYGVSVNDRNACELFPQPDIDDVPVGGARLKPYVLMSIIQAGTEARN